MTWQPKQVCLTTDIKDTRLPAAAHQLPIQDMMQWAMLTVDSLQHPCKFHCPCWERDVNKKPEAEEVSYIDILFLQM